VGLVAEEGEEGEAEGGEEEEVEAGAEATAVEEGGGWRAPGAVGGGGRGEVGGVVDGLLLVVVVEERACAETRGRGRVHDERDSSEPVTSRSLTPMVTSVHHYELLADGEAVPSPPRRRRTKINACLTIRRVLVVLPFLFLFIVLCSGIPPTYNDIRSFEQTLPQHNLSALYLRFPDHLWGHGLNNFLQEASVPFIPTVLLSHHHSLLLSYLAAKNNRSYVFEDYVWSRLPLPYTLDDFSLRPVRLPLNAFISGPTAGGPTSSYPPAVSAQFWQSVCPPEKQRIVSSTDTPGNHASVIQILTYWEDKLKNVQDPCLSIDSSQTRIFDFE